MPEADTKIGLLKLDTRLMLVGFVHAMEAQYKGAIAQGVTTTPAPDVRPNGG